MRSQATEANLVHLACHGLADDTVGNLFGALVLTPGPTADTDPADDGFLTLGEIHSLDFQRSELAILSACNTNAGPLQKGEGVWALSRGFLAAGARRVVASNWVVDDAAAAGLVALFCEQVAKTENAETVSYARALRTAKLEIRYRKEWENPYFWSSLVLIGPD